MSSGPGVPKPRRENEENRDVTRDKYERMKASMQNPQDENQRFLDEMMGKFGPGPS